MNILPQKKSKKKEEKKKKAKVFRTCAKFHTRREKYFLNMVINQTEIRLYLPFSDYFENKRNSVC